MRQNWDLADQYISTAMTADRDIDDAFSAIQGLGARIERERKPASSYRPSSSGYSNHGSSHSHTTSNTTVVVNGGINPYYDPYNNNMINALDRMELNEERRELNEERREMNSGWGRSEYEPSRRDDDRGMDGDCGAASSFSDSFDGDSGPASIPSMPSFDNDTFSGGFDGGSSSDD